MEILGALETSGYIAKAILIDGAPEMAKELALQKFGDTNDFAMFQTNVLSTVISGLTKIKVSQCKVSTVKLTRKVLICLRLFVDSFVEFQDIRRKGQLDIINSI